MRVEEGAYEKARLAAIGARLEEPVADIYSHPIMKGRLALALSSARAGRCKQKTCRRLRHCTAQYGQPGSDYNAPIGACPSMSQAEWRAVSLGMMMNYCRLEGWFRAKAAVEAAAEKRKRRQRPPAEEPQRRRIAPAAKVRRQPAVRAMEYFVLLWCRVGGAELRVPNDRRASERRLLETLSKAGCRCAVAGRIDGCDELADECVTADVGRGPGPSLRQAESHDGGHAAPARTP